MANWEEHCSKCYYYGICILEAKDQEQLCLIDKDRDVTKPYKYDFTWQGKADQ